MPWSASPAGEPAGASFLVVADRDTAADPAVRAGLDLYVENVHRLFAMRGKVVEIDPFDPAAPGRDISAVRDLIKRHYLEDRIEGAILLGKIPYMVWRQAAGGTWVNYGTEDFYFADLDAEFLDNETRYGNGNSDIRAPSKTNNVDNLPVPGRERAPDGQYDTYRRGPLEGPEIWVSRLYAPSGALYAGYFNKVNTCYADILARLAAAPGAAVTPFRNILYAGHPHFAPHPQSDKYRFFDAFNNRLAGSQHVVLGTNGGATVQELFSSYAARSYLFGEVDGHADPYNHDLKDSRYDTTFVMRQLGPGQGALIQALWGCHSGDFKELNSGRFPLTFAYVLSPGVTQASYGCGWTSGTEEAEKEILTHMEQGDHLGLAFRKMQARLYARPYMEKFFLNETRHLNHFLPAGAPETERLAELMSRLLRGYNLVGNPFLKITYTRPAEASKP